MCKGKSILTSKPKLWFCFPSAWICNVSMYRTNSNTQETTRVRLVLLRKGILLVCPKSVFFVVSFCPGNGGTENICKILPSSLTHNYHSYCLIPKCLSLLTHGAGCQVVFKKWYFWWRSMVSHTSHYQVTVPELRISLKIWGGQKKNTRKDLYLISCWRN